VPRVILFLSGEGGWDATAGHIARQLAAANALVIGVDDRRYLAALERQGGACSYPAADLERVSQHVQRALGRARYTPPVLVGHSSGAALAYGALAQAPPGTFAGAVSLGFCPTLVSARRFCRGSGPAGWSVARHSAGTRFAPDSALAAPWVVLQGVEDSMCPMDSVRAFVEGVPAGRLVPLPGVGHGFGEGAAWLPAFRVAIAGIASAPTSEVAATADAVRDLPLVEVPARAAPVGASPVGDELAVIVSGDGGWASLDRQIGEVLAARGVPVVGLNSLQYFWKPRTPDGAAGDLARILRHYLAAWHKGRAVLIGYSRGADVLPFMATRLPADLRGRVSLVALLGESRTSNFEFHLTDWFGEGKRAGDLATVPEIGRLRSALGDRPILCFYGTREVDTACRGLDAHVATVIALSGGHHFDGDFPGIAARILREIPAAGDASHTAP
jgi:type IV secretory pathway VirJ component